MKSTEIILGKKPKKGEKNHVGNTVTILSVLWWKLQCFLTWLSFITKLNSKQLIIKRNKIDEDNFRKKYYKKKHKRNWKKTMWGKTLSIHSVLWGKTCTCNCNS